MHWNEPIPDTWKSSDECSNRRDNEAETLEGKEQIWTRARSGKHESTIVETKLLLNKIDRFPLGVLEKQATWNLKRIYMTCAISLQVYPSKFVEGSHS